MVVVGTVGRAAASFGSGLTVELSTAFELNLEEEEGATGGGGGLPFFARLVFGSTTFEENSSKVVG